jgi:subtilase family serine protease
MRYFVALASTLVAMTAAAICAAAPGDAATRTPASPATTADFSIRLPLRNDAELDALLRAVSDPVSPIYHHFLTPAQFAARFAPLAATRTRAIAYLRAAGFAVDVAGPQSLRVHGTARTVEAAFGTHLGIVHDAASGRARLMGDVAMKLPAPLAALGASVIGFERFSHRISLRAVPANRYGAAGPYWFTDLKEAYGYPSLQTLSGRGVTIGIVMASDILDSDLATYFQAERFSAVSGRRAPVVTRRPVLGGASFDPTSDASFEASADVQQSLGSAPGANLLLYDIPVLGDDAILAAYTDIVLDNAVDVVSSSIGNCELEYTKAYNNGIDVTGVLQAFHDIYRQGNAQGITFVAASGDDSGLGCPSLSYFNGGAGTWRPGVSSFASDPNVTGVGGTNLETTASTTAPLRAQYVHESAFADPLTPSDPYGTGGVLTGGLWGSGSGSSVIWTRPSYQNVVHTGSPMRTVPDVSMHMGGCPLGAVTPCQTGASADLVVLGGSIVGAVGTSLSAPEFAGLVALKIEAQHTRLGNINPLLYDLSATNHAFPYYFFHHNIAGSNGVVRVGTEDRDYNPILGVGTPHAADFLGYPTAPLAGDPQTPTNP